MLIPEPQAPNFAPRFEDLTMMIYGDQGAGKTSFFSGEEDPLICAVEPGAEYVNGRVVQIDSWVKFTHLVAELRNLKQADPLAISSVIIDIVDGLYTHCLNHVCGELGISHPSDAGYGKGWNKVKTEWETWLSRLYHLVPIRFITHQKEEEEDIKNDQGLLEKRMKKAPQFSGSKCELIKGWVRLVGHMYIDYEGRHCISFGKSAIKLTKDRTGVLEDVGDIQLPAETGRMMKDKLLGFPHVEKLYEEKASELGMVLLNHRRLRQ